MMALSLEESVMTKLINAAESRVILRCLEYHNNNPCQKKIDELSKKLKKLIIKIRKFNESVIDKTSSEFGVSDFLNESSPAKQSNKRDSK